MGHQFDHPCDIPSIGNLDPYSGTFIIYTEKRPLFNFPGDITVKQTS